MSSNHDVVMQPLDDKVHRLLRKPFAQMPVEQTVLPSVRFNSTDKGWDETIAKLVDLESPTKLAVTQAMLLSVKQAESLAQVTAGIELFNLTQSAIVGFKLSLMPTTVTTFGYTDEQKFVKGQVKVWQLSVSKESAPEFGPEFDDIDDAIEADEGINYEGTLPANVQTWENEVSAWLIKEFGEGYAQTREDVIPHLAYILHHGRLPLASKTRKAKICLPTHIYFFEGLGVNEWNGTFKLDEKFGVFCCNVIQCAAKLSPLPFGEIQAALLSEISDEESEESDEGSDDVAAELEAAAEVV